MPTIDLRRAEPIAQFTLVAAGLALKHAGFLVGVAAESERVGVVLGLTRGPVAAQERFRDKFDRNGPGGLGPQDFPPMVVSTITGQVAEAFQLRGMNSTLVDGTTAGLHALCHAVEVLRADDGLDALVVIAADELAPLSLKLAALAGGLSPTADGVMAYHENSRGTIPGEGAAAVVLERAGAAARRGARPLAYVGGIGLSASDQPARAGDALSRALAQALRAADVTASDVDLIVGCAVRRPMTPSSAAALSRLCAGGANPCPITAIAHAAGVSEAASGLFAVAAAVGAIVHGAAPPLPFAAPSEWGSLAGVNTDSSVGNYRRRARRGQHRRRQWRGGFARRAEDRIMSRAGASRVVVTGIGIISPIGNTPEEVSRSILGGVSAVRQCAETIRGKPVFAGKIKLDLPDDPAVDRTGQLAIEAARRALADAFGGGSGAVDPLRIGLALGTSHGGRSQLDRLAEDDGDPFAARAASRFAAVGTHHAQTTAVVSALGLGGPTVTLSNACGSSGSALEVGFDWVRSGSCAAAIVGGADGYAHLTQAGFAALGATSPGPNAPFSLPVGISLGEAAGFVILETLDAALARGATVRAEIFACASTWDAYHLTEPEPSGDGLGRALERAAARAGWDAARIGFVHAHGTGTRMNDAAECRALTRFFGADVPPVCSSKSMTGHVLGASAVVGLVVGIVAMNQGVIPPTVNFQEPRPGCGFDFVPNVPRVAAVSGFAVEVAGFGGANAVALVGLPGPRNAAGGPVDRLDDVVITGVGVVSPLGFDGATLADAAAAGRSGIVPLDRFEVNQRAARHGALLHGATVRKRASSLGLRRADAVVEYAAVAADDACRQAGWATLTADVGARIGLVVGTTRGEASRFEAYLESARGGVWERAARSISRIS